MVWRGVRWGWGVSGPESGVRWIHIAGDGFFVWSGL